MVQVSPLTKVNNPYFPFGRSFPSTQISLSTSKTVASFAPVRQTSPGFGSSSVPIFLPFTEGWLYSMLIVASPTFIVTNAGGLGRLDLSACAQELKLANKSKLIRLREKKYFIV